jgi:hypothetical protein
MLDSRRLSSLLQDALSWEHQVSSFLVSATNGSILAYAYRGETPKIVDIRTQSTTITTAYTMAAEDTLIFEAQDSGAISVITPVADRILLAVTSPEPIKTVPTANGHSEDYEQATGEQPSERDGRLQTVQSDEDADTQQLRNDLESLSQELSEMLREELGNVIWPDDI